ncbi:hypothetical protein [Runella zeae]|uniref:hypothetical protein n=1 Tax=Runella zeae TaxID=94255 RepID=UPI00048E72F4|nr:hypothetical protein [Runella zeae]
MKAVLNYSTDTPWVFLLLNISMGFFSHTVAAIASLLIAANQFYIMQRRVNIYHEGSWKKYIKYCYDNLNPKK